MLNLVALEQAAMARQPFPYFAASNVLDEAALDAISKDFPHISEPGIFPLADLRFGAAFARLIEEIRSRELEALLEEKFGLKLSDKPLMVTVRGHCQKKDGRIHTDSKDKLVTCLLYLNDKAWNADGGRLRLLRDGRDLQSTIVEVPPHGGNFVAFQRSDNSWHGHAPFEGPRRYVMFNWVTSETTLAKNLGRHRLSALFKRMRGSYGY
ncbi:MAG: 2OG-Fe(II) oxygenase [Hyphomicrobiales bacterium]|nr:2OG-Fe(II) oxygenase [Hyphomicrobiales bacterium]